MEMKVIGVLIGSHCHNIIPHCMKGSKEHRIRPVLADGLLSNE